MRSLHSSRGGLLCHIVTIIPWLLGGVFAALPFLMLFLGFYSLAVFIATLISIQYLVNIPKRPSFSIWLKDLQPRSYYKACSLRGDIAGISKEKTILAYHPHGILCGGFSWNGVHSPELQSSKITFLVSRVLVHAPIFGWIVKWLGNLESADAKTMTGLMKKGHNIAFVPGGFEEATLQERGVERVFILRRKGWIKYALRHGYSVRPVYTFGEVDTYSTLNWFLPFRMALNKFNIPTVFFFGAWFFPLFPRQDSELHTFIGDSIQFPLLKESELTDSIVLKWHEQYVRALVALFEKHKGEVGKAHLQLDVR